jgi:hypothetical protein
MSAQLTRNLIQISNNSILTNSIAILLNDKLSTEEQNLFNRWIELVKFEHDIELSRLKNKFR